MPILDGNFQKSELGWKTKVSIGRELLYSTTKRPLEIVTVMAPT